MISKAALLFLFCCSFFPRLEAAGVERFELDRGWRVRNPKTAEDWLPARVPGTLLADLLAAGKIPDPFQNCLHLDLAWIERESWEYALDFDWAGERQAGRLFLVLDGLDTHAEVLLNDQHLLEADNMFRSWRTEVGELLKPGQNKLRIIFRPPGDYISGRAAALPFQLPGGDWAWIRKAAFHFGWDFAPRLAGPGIWQPVYLQLETGLFIRSGSISTLALHPGQANLRADCRIYSPAGKAVFLEVRDRRNDNTLLSRRIRVEAGENRINKDFSLAEPELWWPAGMGRQHLYDLEMLIRDEEGNQDRLPLEVGIRTIELINQPDEPGTSFHFRINGRVFFARGANIVPPHSYRFHEAQRWTELVAAARAGNMNMLRVWGGGIYPPDEFFAACGRAGILVWQDFMFACAMYPWDEEFLANVREEAFQQVERLRKFTSLALWCGNNEVSEGWHNWGWRRAFTGQADREQETWAGYQRIFHQLLPEVVSEVDPGRAYWPSSPQFGWGRPESLDHGDAHYWGVWWGREPLKTYRQKIPRFMSEFGLQSLPSLAGLGEFSPLDAGGGLDQLACRQKNEPGFETIGLYLDQLGFKPQELRQFVYLSQVNQALGLQAAIEAQRLAAPRCQGSLYWQLNDCWPGISWSSIDFSGRWKAAHYQVKRSFAPQLAVIDMQDEHISVKLLSDDAGQTPRRLKLELFTPAGRKLHSWKLPKTSCRENEPAVLRFDPPPAARNQPQVLAMLKWGDSSTAVRAFSLNFPPGWAAWPDPQVRIRIRKKRGRTFLLVRSKRPVLFLEIENQAQDLRLSDNYLHLAPGETIRLEVLAGRPAGLKALSLRDYLPERETKEN